MSGRDRAGSPGRPARRGSGRELARTLRLPTVTHRGSVRPPPARAHAAGHGAPTSPPVALRPPRPPPRFPGVYWHTAELTSPPTTGRARIAKGIEVVPTPGHAPGHQSLAADLPESGRVVLCGDAAFTRENLERGVIRAPDEAAAEESLAYIRSLVKDDLDRAFVSHDMAAWSGWRSAPRTYR